MIMKEEEEKKRINESKLAKLRRQIQIAREQENKRKRKNNRER